LPFLASDPFASVLVIGSSEESGFAQGGGGVWLSAEQLAKPAPRAESSESPLGASLDQEGFAFRAGMA
jgi:hypothetical protein